MSVVEGAHPVVWRYLRVLLASILVSAAALKVWTAGDLLRSSGMLSTPLLIATAVGFEVAAGVLIASSRPRAAYRVAITVFGLLAIVAGTAWWSGYNCQCFGPRTSSGAPLLVDLFCLAALAGVRGSFGGSAETMSVPRRWVSLPRSVVVALALALPSALMGWAAAKESETPVRFGKALIGEQFPLLNDLDVRRITPAEGKTLFVLLRPECGHCRKFVWRWQAAPPRDEANRRVVGVVMSPRRWTFTPAAVTLEPHGAPSEFVVPWEKERQPLVASPMLIATDHHRVVNVVSGEEATKLIDAPGGVSQIWSSRRLPDKRMFARGVDIGEVIDR